MRGAVAGQRTHSKHTGGQHLSFHLSNNSEGTSFYVLSVSISVYNLQYDHHHMVEAYPISSTKDDLRPPAHRQLAHCWYIEPRHSEEAMEVEVPDDVRKEDRSAPPPPTEASDSRKSVGAGPSMVRLSPAVTRWCIESIMAALAAPELVVLSSNGTA